MYYKSKHIKRNKLSILFVILTCCAVVAIVFSWLLISHNVFAESADVSDPVVPPIALPQDAQEQDSSIVDDSTSSIEANLTDVSEPKSINVSVNFQGLENADYVALLTDHNSDDSISVIRLYSGDTLSFQDVEYVSYDADYDQKYFEIPLLFTEIDSFSNSPSYKDLAILLPLGYKYVKTLINGTEDASASGEINQDTDMTLVFEHDTPNSYMISGHIEDEYLNYLTGHTISYYCNGSCIKSAVIDESSNFTFTGLTAEQASNGYILFRETGYADMYYPINSSSSWTSNIWRENKSLSLLIHLTAYDSGNTKFASLDPAHIGFNVSSKYYNNGVEVDLFSYFVDSINIFDDLNFPTEGGFHIGSWRIEEDGTLVLKKHLDTLNNSLSASSVIDVSMETLITPVCKSGYEFNNWLVNGSVKVPGDTFSFELVDPIDMQVSYKLPTQPDVPQPDVPQPDVPQPASYSAQDSSNAAAQTGDTYAGIIALSILAVLSCIVLVSRRQLSK